ARRCPWSRSRRSRPRRPARRAGARRRTGTTACGSWSLRRRPLGGAAVEELADQVLEDHRRLRERDAIALGEHLFVAARREPDVLLAEQPRREDLRRGILREPVALVERERDLGLVALVVEADRLDATDDDAGAAHRGAGLQPADV